MPRHLTPTATPSPPPSRPAGNHPFARLYDEKVPDTWHIINADDAVTRGGKFFVLVRGAAAQQLAGWRTGWLAGGRLAMGQQLNSTRSCVFAVQHPWH